MSSNPNFSFPIIITDSGLQPQLPASLLQQLLAEVSSTNPGYTVLPSGLIEDVSSTQIAGISLIDQAKVELVNSLTPNGANLFLLSQLAQIYLGETQPGLATNTSVVVTFTGSVGYVIAEGFLVGDGTNTYEVQSGGVLAGSGTTATLTTSATCISTNTSFTPAANSVTTLLTIVPSVVVLSVNNTSAGTPGGTPETYYAWRARVLQAGLASAVGTPRFIKTMLGLVLGAQSNLISVQQASPGIRVVVGGSASTYNIAYAIFQSVADVSQLVGHAANGTTVTVSLNDYPNTYSVIYVSAPVQTVTLTITWNTIAGGTFTGGSAFPALVQPPLVAYINGLSPGQVINILEMNEIFQQAVEDVLDVSLLTRLVFAVYINSSLVSPGAGESYVVGDAESSYNIVASGITVTQG
jgi:Baseplate J-like protein